MISFKEFLLEYFKGNPILNPRFTNGKDPNRAFSGKRKHITSIKKEYEYKDPLVKTVALGQANNLIVPYNRLLKILSLYKITPELGIKTLGNSKVQVQLYLDKQNNLTGKLQKRS